MAPSNDSVEASITGGNHLRIQNPQEGATVSGQIKVVLVNAREHRCQDVTTLWIDGRFRGHTNTDLLYMWKHGVNREDFFLETCLHSNGEHVLSVTDEFGGSDARRVIFHNAISAVEVYSAWDADPPGEHEFPYFIRAVVTPPQDWCVELKSLFGPLVRCFEGHGDRIDLHWDGKDEQGRPVDTAEDVMPPYGVYMTVACNGVAVLVGNINDLSIR